MKQISKLVVVAVAFSTIFASNLMAAPQKGGSNFHLGIASDGVMTGSATVPGVTALLAFNDRAALQMYYGITAVNAAVQMGGGAKFKYFLTGGIQKGFFVGGGLGLGAKNAAGNTFFIHIAPSFGGHFEISDGVLIGIDASMAFMITTSPGGAFDMSLGGNSGMLGASIMFAI